MKTDMRIRGALRLTPCTYGLSKVSFRGPMRPTDSKYIAFLGGSETFAKYVEQPFPDLVEAALGEVCVNLGCQSAGPDVFLQDTAVQSLCHDAATTVIQILGTINQSNPFHKVHPRRNDRFIAPTEKLVALYPEIDFTEIAFTGHLISRLRDVSEERFALVRAQLEQTWLRRMKSLIGKANSPVILLWLGSQKPQQVAQSGEPAFVTRGMLNQLRPYVADLVEVHAEVGNTDGMNFAPLEELTARESIGPSGHIDIAKALRGPLIRCLG